MIRGQKTRSNAYQIQFRSLETIERICGALNISLCDFFVFDGKVNKEGYISEDEIAIIEVYRPLSTTAKQRVLAYAKGSLETEQAEK